jgi:excisionase family DNA binding protein
MALLSMRQAAAILGVTRARVQVLVKSGRLPAIRVDTFYVLEEDDVQAFAALERPAHRPKKDGSDYRYYYLDE